MEISARHHLRADAVASITEHLESLFGVSIDADTFEAIEFADADHELVLTDGVPTILRLPEDPVLTVQGANRFEPTDRRVTVDAGAVSFVSDGADVMRPGIVDADESIASGDPVVIIEETHGKALAIGRARTEGTDMLGEQGKVVDSIHHVGDDVFAFSP